MNYEIVLNAFKNSIQFILADLSFIIIFYIDTVEYFPIKKQDPITEIGVKANDSLHKSLFPSPISAYNDRTLNRY